MDFAAVREKYPEYDDMTDIELAGALHKQHYSDVPMDDFLARIGVIEQKAEGGKATAIDKIKDLFTGESRETRAVQELPELQSSGLLAGEDVPKWMGAAILATPDPAEIADIITGVYPHIGRQQDEAGNILLANNETGARTVINKPGLSKLDFIQGLGIAMAYAPAGRAVTKPAQTIARRAMLGGGAAAATEAGIQAGQKASGGSFDKEPIIAAGIIGGAGQAVEDVASAGGRAIAGGGQAAKERHIIDSGAQHDIPVMTSDVVTQKTFAGRHAAQTAEKIPFVGTGPARAAQQVKRGEAVDRFAEQYGSFSHDAIMDSLVTQKNRVKNAAGRALNNYGRKIDDSGEIDVSHTLAVIRGVREAANKPGVKKQARLNEMLDEYEELLGVGQSYAGLKKNRGSWHHDQDAIDALGRSQLPSDSLRLSSKVANAMGEDMKAAARQRLTGSEFAKWQRANKTYAEHAKTMQKTAIKNVLDKGDITPEKAMKMVMSKDASDVNLMYRSLTPSGRKHVRSALISGVINRLKGRAAGVTPSTFASEMQKMKMPVGIFFKGEEKKQLDGLLAVLNATRRAQDAPVTTPTGQSLGAVTAAGSMYQMGTVETLLAAATAGAIANIYESPMVRNALVRMAGMPRGSAQFEPALSTARRAIVAAAQGAPIEEGR